MPRASVPFEESRRGMSELKHTHARRLAIASMVSIVAITAAAQGSAPVLWKDPGNIAALDLFWGKGSEARAPKSPFTFLKVDKTGVQPKMQVRDAAGREWVVKFGGEVHAEIAANRIVWALGYVAEEIYFLPEGIVTGMKDAAPLAKIVAADGKFWNASLQLRDPAETRPDRRWCCRRQDCR